MLFVAEFVYCSPHQRIISYVIKRLGFRISQSAGNLMDLSSSSGRSTPAAARPSHIGNPGDILRNRDQILIELFYKCFMECFSASAYHPEAILIIVFIHYY